MVSELLKFLIFHAEEIFHEGKLLGKVVLKLFITIMIFELYYSPKYWDFYLELSLQYLLSSLVGVCKNAFNLEWQISPGRASPARER